MGNDGESRLGSIGVTIVVAVVMAAVYLEFGVFAGDQIHDALSVSFDEGEEFTVDFEVTEPGSNHTLDIMPIVGTDRPLTDSRYAFAFDALVLGPEGATVLDYSDAKPNHHPRRQHFVPVTAGKHVLKVKTREGSRRADVRIRGNNRQLVIPHIEKLLGG